MAELLLLAGLNLWVAWRYSRQPIGQDLGLWMLWGFTGARPYRDHVDCKPPGIHLWGWLLARVTGRRLALAQFLHHAAIGGFAVAAYRLTGKLEAGLLFTALAQSAWLSSYLTWLEQISAGFLLLALLLGPWGAAGCLALAVLFNLKLAPSAVVLLTLRGWWLPLAVLVLGGLAVLAVWRLLWPRSFADVWYGAVTVPRRMAARRGRGGRHFLVIPWRDLRWDRDFAVPLLLVVPAVVLVVQSRPGPVLLAVLGVYVAVNLQGRVWRAYHWIPLAACAAAAPAGAGLVLLAEWVSSCLYLGDLVRRTRPESADGLRTARAMGKRLRGVSGSLWVADLYTQIHVYAGKPPAYGLVEQVEIRDVIPERREAASQRPAADLVVLGPGSIPAAPRGYRVVLTEGPFTVLARPGHLDAPGNAG
jgi:hypothetical protein